MEIAYDLVVKRRVAMPAEKEERYDVQRLPKFVTDAINALPTRGMYAYIIGLIADRVRTGSDELKMPAHHPNEHAALVALRTRIIQRSSERSFEVFYASIGFRGPFDALGPYRAKLQEESQGLGWKRARGGRPKKGAV